MFSRVVVISLALVALAAATTLNYNLYSSSTTCSGSPTTVSYNADGSCHSSSGSGSYKITVSGSTATETVYSDSACATSVGTASWTNGACVAGSGSSYSVTWSGSAGHVVASVGLMVAAVAATLL